MIEPEILVPLSLAGIKFNPTMKEKELWLYCLEMTSSVDTIFHKNVNLFLMNLQFNSWIVFFVQKFIMRLLPFIQNFIFLIEFTLESRTFLQNIFTLVN